MQFLSGKSQFEITISDKNVFFQLELRNIKDRIEIVEFHN
jgi:hypothetical protein